MVDWVSVGDECILAGKCFHLFSLTLTRTNIMIPRKLALCVTAGNSTAPFPSSLCIIRHCLHQLTRYARLWRILHSWWSRSNKSAFFWTAKAHALSPILTSHSTRKRAQVFEVLVLYFVDVTKAVEWLSKASKGEKKGDARRTYKPIEVLGCLS